MRAERVRKKKLVVAFHFQFSDQAGWECDTCRRSGLDVKRRCGWLPEALLPAAKIVWARKQVRTETCPKSLVSAESLRWVEQFIVWKKLGANYPCELSARDVEAFLILELEVRAEGSNGRE